MRIVTVFQTLGPVDIKNVRRDSLLVWMPVLPFVVALIMRVGVPELTVLLEQRLKFNLMPYYPILASFFLLMLPMIAGLLTGFLLLDERDEQMLRMLFLTPMSMNSYLIYRLSMPVLISVVMGVLAYPIMQIVPLSPTELWLITGFSALLGPIYALFLVAFAEDKVVGFTMMKLAQGILMLPIAAILFLPEQWQWVAGVIPSYWVIRIMIEVAAHNVSIMTIAFGLLVNFALLGYFVRRFNIVARK